MEIKYAGPKVLFSRKGIDFDNNKDDKFVYLNIAVQLLRAFNHEYQPGEKYVYDASSKRLNDNDILKFMQENFAQYDELVKKAQVDAEGYFEHEIKKAQSQKDMMSEIEYDSWIKNIELMKNYVLQRHFNKNIYYALIEKISLTLKKNGIAQIHAPMFQNFIHVLHSIQGTLKKKPEPKSSHLNIYEKDGILMASLDIG